MPIRNIAFSSRFGRKEIENEKFYIVLVKGIILSLIDILLTFAVGTFTFYVLAGYAISPRERGFYCDDLSITKPLLPHTITPKHLLLVTLGIPFLIVFVCEALFFARFRNKTACLRKYFASSTGIYLAYLLAFSVATLMMEMGKCGFGRLRPHFLEACKPDWSLIDCKTDPTAYIADAHCTNDPRIVRIGRGSFPSGHSEGAVIALVFLYYYLTEVVSLCKAPRDRYMPTMRTVILVLFAIWTVVCCVTRVTDCWHHPTDVLGGVTIGFISMYIPFARTTRDYALSSQLSSELLS